MEDESIPPVEAIVVKNLWLADVERPAEFPN